MKYSQSIEIGAVVQMKNTVVTIIVVFNVLCLLFLSLLLVFNFEFDRQMLYSKSELNTISKQDGTNEDKYGLT